MGEQDIPSLFKLAPAPCRHEETEPVVLMKVNGDDEVRLLCLNSDCQYQIGGQTHAMHPDRAQYPILTDRRGTNPPCARCDNQNTERHHWAPSAHFEDSEKWPQDYLCVGCHVFWHRRMTV